MRPTSDSLRDDRCGAVLQPGFARLGWHDAFDTEPEETVRVRVGLLRELAATRQPFAAAHVHSAVCRVSAARDVFRWVPDDGAS